MDTWLSQVSLCDAVISVANTTIHGSGGLSIPTMCLLSRFADWRWFNDESVTTSYWYPSVSIARESRSEVGNQLLILRELGLKMDSLNLKVHPSRALHRSIY